MVGQTYGTTEDGKYDIVSLTPDKLNEALEVVKKSYFVDENLSKAVELQKHPKAINALAELTKNAAKDGCSLIAIERKTGRIAAVVITKFQFPVVKGQRNFYEDFIFNCEEPAAECLIEYMNEANKKANLFELCNVDCTLEIMFAAALTEHRNKGLVTALCTAIMMLARTLLDGKNVKVPIGNKQLALDPVPKMISGVCTTIYTQKVAKSLGCKTACKFGFDGWSFNGKQFANMVGPETSHSSVIYCKL